VAVFCLIHGSAQHSGVWDLLLPELQKRGHRAIVVDLPSDQPQLGAEAYARVVADSLGGTGGEAIVVAHSASGLLLPAVAELRAVRRLVFLAGAIPRLGESFLDQLRRESDVMFNPEWIGQDPSTDEAAAMRFILHDCEPEIANWALTVKSPWYPEGLYSEVCPLAEWPALPSSYIVCTGDRTFRPDWSRAAARELLGVEAIELPGGHCPHISRSGDLADVLSTLASLD
jgi:pimeloyl-ACP methyl ester carboxylesterase